MERMRKPFQGVWNIIRFNWHFYVLSFVVILVVVLLANFIGTPFRYYLISAALLIVGTTLISLLVSFYVYDLSDLYQLNWLKQLKIEANSKIVNINAGFDETSVLLKAQFKDSELVVFDFYDPSKHTEISIKRARKAYPPYPKTKAVQTSNLPLNDNSVDFIFVILSAHEIRNELERISFFQELNRILNPSGKIVVIEHLRDLPNFLAYNIGFFHFHSKTIWFKTFQKANLNILKEMKITSFISTFILEKHGATS
jgi:ubiquinone/menaquinone biosynthesis C-methylase UbiE